MFGKKQKRASVIIQLWHTFICGVFSITKADNQAHLLYPTPKQTQAIAETSLEKNLRLPPLAPKVLMWKWIFQGHSTCDRSVQVIDISFSALMPMSVAATNLSWIVVWVSTILYIHGDASRTRHRYACAYSTLPHRSARKIPLAEWVNAIHGVLRTVIFWHVLVMIMGLFGAWLSLPNHLRRNLLHVV